MNTTFTAAANFSTDLVAQMGTYLGYSPTITENVLDENGAIVSFQEAKNPQSVNDFIAADFKKYCAQYAAAFWIDQINKAVEVQRQQQQAVLNSQIESAITVEVTQQ